MKKKFLTVLLAVLLILSSVPSFSASEARTGENALDMKVGDTKSGFVLDRKEYVNEIDSTAYIFSHTKSGARLMYIANEDENKTFATGYRTRPADDKGIPHIVEHALLSGSRKYKTKEPFMDLTARSLATFMNALTYPDKTIFPISSRNTKDFENLMDVYLDAVFYPSMLEDETIFQQEGWHYDMPDKDSPLSITGVVYNEMKGAMADPISNLYHAMMSNMFPDTTYNFNSGGDPDVIPSLTFEQYKKFYHDFYNPSNSYMYLYGKLDIAKYLAYIDKEYLSNFDKTPITSQIQVQKMDNKRKVGKSYYPVAIDEDITNKDMFGLAFYTGEAGDQEQVFTDAILASALIDANGAPVKEALLESEICEDVGSFNFTGRQNYFAVAVLNAERNSSEKFEKIVYDTLKKVYEEGIDKNLIEAAINELEFYYKEAEDADGNIGLGYYMTALESWIHDKDPLMYLSYGKTLDDMKEKAKTDYFEKYLKEKILDNKNVILTIVKAMPGMQEAKDTRLDNNLQLKIKANMSEEEINNIIAMNEKLQTKIDTPDSEEALATIPKLPLSEINKDSGKLFYKEKEIARTKTLHVDEFSNGIVYLNLQFDLSTVDPEKLPYAALLSNLLTNVSTKNYNYGELGTEIGVASGGISFSTSNSEHVTTGALDSRLVLSTKFTSDKTEDVVKLLDEISFNTDFTDKTRLSQILNSMNVGLSNDMVSSGNNYAAKRARSYYSPLFAYREKLNGMDYVRFIQDSTKNFEKNSDKIIEELNSIYKIIFNKNNLIIGITAPDSDYKVVEKHLPEYLNKLSKSNITNGKFNLKVEQKNEAFTINSPVNYVVKSASLKSAGEEQNGKVNVLLSILSNLYLHSNLRAKGGAYGGATFVDNYGNVVAYSYRDPNLKETIKVYDEMGDFAKMLAELPKEELEAFIIGTVGNVDYLRTPADKANEAVYNYINGIDNEYKEKQLEQILTTTPKELADYSSMLKKLMEENNICVFGSEESIKNNATLFKSIEPANK